VHGADRYRDFFAISFDSVVGFLGQDRRKYVLHLADGRTEKFDLARDPAEQMPSPANPAEAEMVRRAVAGWVRYNLSHAKLQ